MNNMPNLGVWVVRRLEPKIFEPHLGEEGFHESWFDRDQSDGLGGGDILA